MYLLDSRDIILITREVYIVNNLSTSILLKINIIKLESIVLDLQRNIIIIDSYNNLKVLISIYIK